MKKSLIVGVAIAAACSACSGQGDSDADVPDGGSAPSDSGAMTADARVDGSSPGREDAAADAGTPPPDEDARVDGGVSGDAAIDARYDGDATAADGSREGGFDSGIDAAKDAHADATDGAAGVDAGVEGTADSGADATVGDAGVEGTADSGADATVGEGGLGFDSGAAVDGGLDATTHGPDAAAEGGCVGSACVVPNCAVDVSPPVVALSGTLTATLTSQDADRCSATVDGNSLLAIPCAGTTTWPATSFGGAGRHTVLVDVAGPGGASSCSATWTVTGAPGAPTCSVAVTPLQGRVTDTYNASLTSTDATSCAYRVDNGAATSVPCTTTLSFAGALVGEGTHVAVVTATGANGTATCSAAWTETP